MRKKHTKRTLSQKSADLFWEMSSCLPHQPSRTGARTFLSLTPYVFEGQLDKYHACPKHPSNCWPSFVGDLSCTCTVDFSCRNVTWRHPDHEPSLSAGRRAENLRATVSANGLKCKGNTKLYLGKFNNSLRVWKEVIRSCGARICPNEKGEIFQNATTLIFWKVSELFSTQLDWQKKKKFYKSSQVKGWR